MSGAWANALGTGATPGDLTALFGTRLSPKSITDTTDLDLGDFRAFAELRKMFETPITATLNVDDLLKSLTDADDAVGKNKDAWASLRESIKEAERAAEEAARMQVEAFHASLNSISTIMSGISSILQSAGEENFGIAKGFAIAGAVVSGIAGVAAAIADGWKYGPLVAAAQGIAAGVSAAANIASLLQTTSSSTSMPGSAGAVPSVATPDQASGTTINLEVRGDHFGRDTLEQLMRDFVDAQGDGYTLVVT